MPELAPALSPNRRHCSAAPEVSPHVATGQRGGMPLFLQRSEVGGAPAIPTGNLIEEEEELQEIQTKLVVNEPGDAFEQQADRVADQVMRMPETPASAGGASLLEEEEELAPPGGAVIQRKAAEGGGGFIGAGPLAAIRSPGPGSPLAASVRSRVEPVVGADLSNVQVHQDAGAHQAAHALQAKAFTHGHHIWLGAHQSGEDLSLMAHEATHVLQQDGAVHRKPVDGRENAGAPASSKSSSTTEAPPSGPPPNIPAPGSPPETGAPPPGSDKAGGATPPPASNGGGESGGGAASEGGAGPNGVAAAPAEAAELLMPPPPDGLSAEEQARIEGVQELADEATENTTDLPPAEENVAEARGAVEEPQSETSARAENALVEALGARPEPSPEIEELCDQIYRVIRAKRPPDEDSLVNAEPEEMAREAGGQLNQAVEGDAQRVQGEYDSLNEPGEGTPQQQAQEMETPPETAETPDLNAATATPDGVSEEQVDLGPDTAASQQRIEDAGMTSEPAQLVETGPIADARAAQGELVETAQRAPAEVLAEQRAVLAGAEADMAALQAAALEALTSSRRECVGQAVGQQRGMVGSEGQTREQIAAQAQGIFAGAQTRVNTLLEPVSRTAIAQWEAGVQVLSTQFRTDLNRVKAWIDERYSGAGGAVLEFVESWVGMPDWVVEEYDRAEQAFGDGVCDLIRRISTDVNGVIAAAEAIIEDAREQIGELFANLPADLQAWATEQQAQFTERLDGLATRAHETRDNFNRDLTERAAGAVQEVRQEVHALREAAGGLLGRIANAISAFLDDPAKFIIEGLLQLLGISPAAFWAVVNRIGEAIDSIAEDPMSFANNLMTALGQGFQQFFDNFADHMLNGLLEWLFSGLGAVGVQIPSDFSLKSVITFFLQLMGITWPRIRQLLARHIGEENVALIEKAYEIVATLIEMGPEGIFEMIKEQLDPQNILNMVLEAAMNFVTEALIAAVTPRILLLFNPVGAIIQGLEAIYRVLSWVFQNAARIFSLVETIVNGVMDLIAGNTGGMANAIEQGLARLISPVIDFLAGYIGLGDLPEQIADVIRGFQEWVLGILDRVIGFLASQARALLSALGLGGSAGEEGGTGAFDGQVGEPVTFSMDGQSHRIWIATQGTAATVMMASDESSVDARWNIYRQEAARLPEAEQQRALAVIGEGQSVLSQLDAAADQLTQMLADPSTAPEAKETLDSRIESLEGQLAAKIIEVRQALGLVGTNENFSEPEATLLRRLPGGAALLSKLPNVDPVKKRSLLQEGRVALDALARGECVFEISRDVFRTGKTVKGLLTEIDVETENEIIQVKGGARYASASKLPGGDDMRQLTETKRYNEQHRFDAAGNKLPPKTVVWHFTHPPVHPDLIRWLEARQVVVRVAGV